MATLSKANLEIDLLNGRPNYAKVTATVKVNLDQFDEFLLSGGLHLDLQSSVLGGGPIGDILRPNVQENDLLFSFPNQKITAAGTYTFSKVVPRRLLDEDQSSFDDRDEILTSFSLVSKNPLFPLNTISVKSPIVTGKF